MRQNSAVSIVNQYPNWLKFLPSPAAETQAIGFGSCGRSWVPRKQANRLETGAGHAQYKIAAKPLQIETWLLFKAYKKYPVLYSMVPSPTPHDLPFSHNTSVTDDDGRQPCQIRLQHSGNASIGPYTICQRQKNGRATSVMRPVRTAIF